MERSAPNRKREPGGGSVWIVSIESSFMGIKKPWVTHGHKKKQAATARVRAMAAC
jgi:hypothetical protein